MPPHLVPTLQNLATLGHAHYGQTLYRQSDPADYWYSLLSGAAREYTVMADGRRQVVDFLLPGDLFGFCNREEHHMFSVEVIADSAELARFSRRRVEALAEADCEVGRNLREMTLNSIMRLQTRTILLGRPTAVAKVGAFLLEMLSRTADDGNGKELILPMSRYDIADYLGMAVETLSRSFTALRQAGAIELLGSRRVRMLRRDMLELPPSTASLAQVGLSPVGPVGPVGWAESSKPNSLRPQVEVEADLGLILIAVIAMCWPLVFF